MEKMIQISVKESTLPERCREEPAADDKAVVDIKRKEEESPLERMIGPDNNFLPVHFLEEGAKVAKAVALINGRATGFLVASNLLLTNNHVFPDAGSARGARVTFNYQLDYRGNPQPTDTYTPDPNDFFHTNRNLDYSLVRVPGRVINIPVPWLGPQPPLGPPVSPFPGPGPRPRPGPDPSPPLGEEIGEMSEDVGEIDEYLSAYYAEAERRLGRRITIPPGSRWGYIRLDPRVTLANGQHVNIIQHPRLRRKEVALQDNRVERIGRDTVNYKTDTEPGSSGSSVCDNQWDLVALHHAGGDRRTVSGRDVWLNNEGIRITSIIDDLISSLSATPAGTRVLRQLGLR